MKGLIVYNGSINIEKIDLLINEITNEARELNIDFEKSRNSEIFPVYDIYGEARYGQNIMLKELDFVIFWDKDIFLAKYIENLKIPVFNSARAIAICDNKIILRQELSGTGIKSPKTIIGPLAYYKQRLSKNYYDKVVSELGPNFIVKEAKGSFGMQVYQIKGYDSFNDIIEKIGNREFLMQEFVSSSEGRDIRVNIVGDEIIGAMIRKNSDDFRANISLGGIAEVIELTEEQKRLALKAHKKLELDFSGVDLLFGKADEPLLCEVNSNMNFLSFEKISNVNVAKKILEHIILKLNLEAQ